MFCCKFTICLLFSFLSLQQTDFFLDFIFIFILNLAFVQRYSSFGLQVFSALCTPATMLQCKKIFDAEDNNNAAVSGYNVADKAEIEAIVCSSLHTNSIVNFCNSTSGDLILTLNGMSWTHACYQITRENWARQFQTRQSAAYTAMVNTVDKKLKKSCQCLHFT